MDAGTESAFASVPFHVDQSFLAITERYKEDTCPQKVNLSLGAYRNEEGKPLVLGVVKEAEDEMLKELGAGINKEYSAIDGPPRLKHLAQKLLFGDDCSAVSDGRIASVQTLSGCGALYVAAEFVRHQLTPDQKDIWISDATWPAHPIIFGKAGFTLNYYPYYKAETGDIDFENLRECLRGIHRGSVVLLHACGHNPTGADPSEEQWHQIAEVMKERGLVPLLDCAYQGYASGDVTKDAFAIRLFLSMGFEMLVCQSFAKNMGLYGERIGMLHVVCANASLAEAVLSQLKMVIRPMYSSPPVHGAELVVRILGNEERRAAWVRELASMAGRTRRMRALLRKGLEERGSPGQWRHLTDQIGMFSRVSLSEAMCERLTTQHHVYLPKTGRISLVGLNEGNVGYVVDCIDEVIRSCSPGS